MIYRVMSVCWKACGARLLSSQGQRRGGKKGNRKLLLAFVLKGNSTPVCVLPRRLFLRQSAQAKTDAVAFCGRRAEIGRGTLGAPRSAAHSWMGTSLLEGASCHVSWEFSRILLCNRSFPWPGWIFNWLPKKYWLDTWGWTTHWTEEQTCSRLFFFFFFNRGWGGVGRMGWGQSGLQVKQKRGDGLLRLVRSRSLPWPIISGIELLCSLLVFWSSECWISTLRGQLQFINSSIVLRSFLLWRESSLSHLQIKEKNTNSLI